jgi:predicted dehydrogenase
VNRSVLVVGTGSAGTRHVRNLLALGADVSAYSYRGLGSVPGAAGVRLFGRLDEALAARPDAVVIANDTDRHLEVATAAARGGSHLFIEKPLSNSLRGVDALVRDVEVRGLVVETGFMQRFHPGLRWIHAYLADGGLGAVYYARALFGQHLPDWRPGTDYRRCYSARRGVGGVILDRIHELDLLGWLLGPIDDVRAATRQVPSLGIESEAVVQVGLRFRSGALADVHLDYVRPVLTHLLELVGERGVLTWDYATGAVHLTARDGAGRLVHAAPAGFERNDMFLAHMRWFLERLSDRARLPASSLADGVAALRAALACHQSARERRAVDPAAVGEDAFAEEARV